MRWCSRTELPWRCCSSARHGGISHHPDETVREEDVEAALAVATAFLDDLGSLA